MDFLRRAWVEIDLVALKNNYKIIKDTCNTRVISVVKADAYGHGFEHCVKALEEVGCDMFAVSNVLEAVELRDVGIKGDILVLGYTPVETAETLAKNNIIQCVYSLEYATALSEKASELGIEIKAHLKLDTGMSRIGFNCRNEETDVLEIEKALLLDNLKYTGVFMHFASADSNDASDVDFTKLQFERFMDTVSKLEQKGFNFPIKHSCNSAGAISYDDMYLDAVRAGIVLYGLKPSEDVVIDSGIKPVMSMYSVVSQVKTILPEDTVSYGRTFKADKPLKVATITCGYADGVPRLLSNKGRVLINGKSAQIIGRVCMDQFCVDVTDIPDVKIGDVAEIFGNNISVDEVALNAQTINYEIVCGITKRVPKIYK